MMTFAETVNYLYSKLPVYQRSGGAAYKANLDNTLALDQYFKSPHKKFKTIHVAGTNGKGSVSHMLAAILQENGYKTGLYTSPHLLSMCERVKVNGVNMQEEFVTQFITENQAFIEKLAPSFFELMVMMSFEYFALQKVDVAIVETGLGGRLDSTNIISPELSIITNIGLDHTQFLGNTLAKIAGEKAGIIKQNIPVVIGRTQPETKHVFLDRATALNAEIQFADSHFKLLNQKQSGSLNTISFEQKGKSVSCNLDLLGHYQVENLATVLQAIEMLPSYFSLTEKSTKAALEKVKDSTRLLGRWQVVIDNPKIICDTGHNVDGVRQIVKQLSGEYYKQLHVIWGMVNDKDIDPVLKILPQNATYYFTKASVQRAYPEKELLEKAQGLGLKGNAYSSVSQAINTVVNSAEKDDLIFIGGSTFVVADALAFFNH